MSAGVLLLTQRFVSSRFVAGIAVVGAFMLLMSACTSDGGSVPLGSETTVVASSSTESTTSTSAAPTSDPEDLAAIWAELWAASGIEPEDRGPAIDLLGDSIAPEVKAVAAELVGVTGTREVLTDPAMTTKFDGSVEIRDCVLYTPPFRGVTADYIHEGKAEPDGDGGWVITEAAQVGRGCVPAAMADEILEDYAEYNQAFADAGNPADPNHPDLARTMRGAYLDSIKNVMQELLDNGWYLQSLDTSHPEITRIPGSTAVTVIDCAEAHPDSDFYELNGERVEGAVIPEPGERSRREVDMRLEGGQWKTERVQIESQSDCEIAPTLAALPRI